MAQIRIEEVFADAPPPGFWDLLAFSVGRATAETMERVRAFYTHPDHKLAAAFAGERLAGVIGHTRRDDTRLEITHLAVQEDLRRQGVARALVAAISRHDAGFDLVAETDEDAVGFYRAIGFSTEPLPRDKNRTQRWRCRRPALWPA